MEIRAIESLADFEAAQVLIDAMGRWDVEESRKFGMPDDALMEYIYGHTPQTMMKKFGQPQARFFMARLGTENIGCAGYSKSDDGVAELQKMYVSPESRGKGAARGLMTACLDGMRADGYKSARLETVTFMGNAIALYEAFGFKRSSNFREVPVPLQPITVFMQREL